MAATNPSASAGAAANTTNSSSDTKLDQLDVLLPGFSSPIVSMILKYLHIDVSYFLPLIGIISFLGFAWQYLGQYIWSQLEWFISTVEIRVDDEIYEVIKSWVASQPFAQKSHRFVVNTSGFNSRRYWDPLYWRHEEDEGDSEDDTERQTLHYTPAPGNHYFWYKRRLLVFRRNANKEKAGYTSTTEREEISISCLGRNPWVLKQLLLEAQAQYLRRDDDKTLIYRGAMRHAWGDPTWQRSLVRACRPFETVILSQKIKDEIVEDIEEYINPATRRWYANRGIPYRRGYLLHGPPGTGKSSLSLALAGHFGMRIYIVSLSSSIATEEHLSSLFAELPRRCIVLLEDIDTAGLTHTREDDGTDDGDKEPESETEGSSKRVRKSDGGGKLSLSGLLNILDGVASQEGRILIMTTNHLEKLDKALIRPGRVDMTIKFSLADQEISTAIFKSIFAHIEGDDVPEDIVKNLTFRRKGVPLTKGEQKTQEDEERERKLAEQQEKVLRLAAEFARRVPENEFSPAELQGFLLKHKRHPERAVERIEEWVEATRKEKQEMEKAEAEAKRKADERKALRKARRKIKEKQLLKAAKEKLEDDSDGSEDEADSGSDDENSTKKKKSKNKNKKSKGKKSEKTKTVKKAESESETESDAADEEEEQKDETKVENADDGSKKDLKKTGSGQGLEVPSKKLLDVEGDSKNEADSGYETP